MSEQFDKTVFQCVFKIDNVDFTAGLININRKVNILDKYAQRTINGDLKREIIGVYYNYNLTFSQFWDMNQYDVNLRNQKSFIRFIFLKTMDTMNFKGTFQGLRMLLNFQRENLQELLLVLNAISFQNNLFLDLGGDHESN